MSYNAWFDASIKSKEGKCYISGVIEKDNNKILQYSKCKKFTIDNNALEYTALVELLRKVVTLNIQEITIHGDSLNVIMNINGANRIKAKKSQTLAEQAKTLIANIKLCEIKWIPRKMNRVADNLLR